jgi:hypothetical protein
MKTRFILATAFLIACFYTQGQDLQLNEILEKYYQSTGIDKLQKVRTIIMQGSQVQQDIMPLKIVKMRPDKYLMEFDVADLTAFQGFDGHTAWMTTPWTGNSKPQVMPEERAKITRNNADFDGVLYHWKEKGHVAELVGKDSVDQKPAWKIKMTLKDGTMEFYFIDSNDFLLVKKVSNRTVRGKVAEIANYYLDYRNIGGILFPFIIDATLDDQPYTSSQFETIELDQPVDVKIFSLPITTH